MSSGVPALLVALVAAAGLRLPSLSAGLRTDDYVQRAMLDGAFPLARAAHDLYWFSGRDANEAAALLDVGYHPWWTAPGYRLSMLRPLSSALLSLEHALGLGPLAQHAVSLAWLALGIVAASLVLRRLLSPGVAALALLVFALDEAHGVPLSWIANRSALVSGALATLTLWAHLRWRREGWRAGAALGPTCLALALLAGEYGLAVIGYLVAFELWAPAVERAGRGRALAPIGALALAYLALHAAGGYGVRDSGLYLSPLSDPLAYTLAALTRVPALVADLALGLPAHFFVTGHPWRDGLIASGWFAPSVWLALPDWQSWHVALGVVALALAAWLVRGRRLGSPEAPWLAAGTLLSLIPMAVSLPSERLLGTAALGASALIALSLGRGVELLRRGARAHFARRLALSLACTCGVLVHVPLAAWRAHRDSAAWAGRAAAERAWALSAPIPAGANVILVGASDFSTEAHVPWIRRAHGKPVPRSYRRLGGAVPYDLTRVAADALELTSITTGVRGTTAGSLYRSEDEPLQAGATVRLPALRVEVLAVQGGEAKRVRYRFDSSLEQAGVWLVATPRGLERLALPAVGGSLRLPRPATPY